MDLIRELNDKSQIAEAKQKIITIIVQLLEDNAYNKELVVNDLLGLLRFFDSIESNTSSFNNID